MNSCPCCSSQLLRHARHNRVYLFCSHCWQEMPDLSQIILGDRQRTRKLESLVKVSPLISKLTVLEPVRIA
jgi:DNA-directed RNA polymerase subunit RPC12/RpoP